MTAQRDDQPGAGRLERSVGAHDLRDGEGEIRRIGFDDLTDAILRRDGAAVRAWGAERHIVDCRRVSRFESSSIREEE